MITRIILSVFALFCLFVFPWWAAALCLITGLILFDYIEIIFFGFLFDMLYSVGDPAWTRFSFLALSFILYGVTSVVKTYFAT